MVSKKILIVDDEPAIIEILSSRLEAAGFQICTARDGVEAVEKVKSESPDLIIMDIKMPEEDGLTACAALKTNARTTSIPVVFVSWVEDVNSKIDGFNAGGLDYITKPFESEELLGKVKKFIG